MPRYPDFVPHIDALPGATYSRLAHTLAAHEGEVYPLHIGDTWMDPAVGCRMQDLNVDDHPGLHRYSSTRGHPALVSALVAREKRNTGLATTASEVLPVAGATAGLTALMATLVSPGDEVILLAPYWPLMSNAVRAMGGVPVPVPFIDVAHDAKSAVAVVEAHRTERTVAIYWNTPNNPTGRVIPADWLAALAQWAEGHGLWIVADEVYEHYTYTGTPHAYSRALAPALTISAHSFSKAYGMAGNRCGYLAGPAAVMDAVHKVTRCTVYSVPTAAQLAAAKALAGPGDAWAAAAATKYAAAGRAAAERLGLPPPEGSTFLFFDLAEHLDGRGLAGFLEDCAHDGLLVAPGSSFGPYPTHVRVCFTAVEPAVTARGIEILAKRLGR